MAIAPQAHASHHAVIVSIDGLRPDVAMRAHMPALRSLMARGSFTFFCATTDTAVTLPSHMSMLTGVPPAKHGIFFNVDPRSGDLLEPHWPTLFTLAHARGMTSAMSTGKSKFVLFNKPDVPEWRFVPETGTHVSDAVAADHAIEFLLKHRPALLFVHLPSPDLVGHVKGWGSPEQIVAADSADLALGRLVKAIGKAGLQDSTLIIVSADHGGAGLKHGGIDARSHFIPWIAAGPGVRHDFDLTRVAGLQVRTEDTFATMAAWLGITLEKPVDGHAMSEMYSASDSVR